MRLKEKEHLTDNIWAFRFEPEEPVSWTAGQYIDVNLPHNNPDTEGTGRSFTVSSAPFEGIVQITTRVTQSTFKKALAALPIGGKIDLAEKPHGDFVWQESPFPKLFIAGGIGITPFRSILKQRAHDKLPLDVTLIYGNRTDKIVFKEELERYDLADPHFKIHYATGQPLTAAKISELEPNFRDCLVYVSGAEPMVQALEKQLVSAGLPAHQFKRDEFPNYTEKNY